ncbi:flagellar hook-associated family protein [Aureimonas psammosilenae]|uniref:flagellar hook-associated family protein n=1 Tax=Aureimonas psammosilenae TaxID=2495496 RepID=UPI001260E5C2|nr:flagellar hook-associated family protein [Aureimonas psammosilenae]
MTISNLSFTASQYKNLQKLQAQLNKSVTEATNSRYADVGLSLGRLTGTAVNYRVQETSFESQLQTNKVVSNRLELIDDALTAINKTATDMKSSALVAKKYPQYSSLAKSGLEQLQGALNTADGGLYVFSGMAADKAPMPAIDKGLKSAQDNYDLFVKEVGGGQAQNITAEQMTQYLSEAGYSVKDPVTNAVVKTYSFFDTVKGSTPGTPWADNWSNASSTSTVATISKTETVETSVSANNDAFRKLVAGYSMLSVIDLTKLTDAVKDAVSVQASTTMTAGTDKITAEQALVGMRQSRIEAVNTALTSQKDVAETAYSDLEGVDPYEASQRMNALELQLNAAMAATARIQKISILDYI